MLKSNVAQNIIESLNSISKIYQRKSVNEDFNIKLNQASLEENTKESTNDNLPKAQVSIRADIHDLIDITIPIAVSVISIPLLPAIESIILSIDTTSLLGKINPLVDFADYDLFNALEVSY